MHFPWQGHTTLASSVFISLDCTRVGSLGVDHTFRLWDCATGTSTATQVPVHGEVKSVAMVPNGSQLVWYSQTDGITIIPVDTVAGSEIRQLPVADDRYVIASTGG
jgi:hypothetical protein